MKKILIGGFLVFIFLFHKGEAFAQMQAQRWVCLQAVHCKANKPESAACAVNNGHRARLTADPALKPMANRQTYIVECLATATGQICTTGNPQTDIEIYGQNNVALANAAVKYEFQGLFKADGVTPESNPKMSGSTGEIGPIEWQSQTTGATRKFMAMNYWTPGVDPVGGPGALQQGSFDFETAERDCVAIYWDPYGRVFDSQSLEPVYGAAVTLLTQRTDGSFTPVTNADVSGGNIINPQTVREDGIFYFLVGDGTYRLTVNSGDHLFPVTDNAKIHPNYSRVYSDIYPAETGEEIVQQRKIQHRDIPLEPVYTPTNRPPKMMEYFYELQKINRKAIVSGRVSHPFTMLTAYSTVGGARNRQLTAVQADRNGVFKIVIDEKKLQPGESFGEVDMAKVDLTLLSGEQNLIKKLIGLITQRIKKVEAQSLQVTTLKFTPIPSNLDGYAYDSQGNRLANTKVGIYLKFSKKPYYETMTDANGYYKISSEYLPNMPYEIRYNSPTSGVVTTQTDEFIAQNQQHLQDTNANVYVYKNQKGEVVEKPIAAVPVTGQPVSSIADQTKNNILLMIGALLFLIIAAVVFLVYYLKKKTPVTGF